MSHFFFQFYDLLNIFKLNGLPSRDNPYLFSELEYSKQDYSLIQATYDYSTNSSLDGDFVDRGSFSVECIFVLFGFKLLYPDHFFMSRGNHESENMNKMYGFEGEVRALMDQCLISIYLLLIYLILFFLLGEGQVLGPHGRPLHRGLQLAAPLPPARQQGASHARRAICQGENGA